MSSDRDQKQFELRWKRGDRMVEAMLTTVDNPFNPFDDFDDWYAYDTRTGHHTLSYLARVVVTSDDMSDADQIAATEAAIDEIVDENVNGLYKKVTREVPTTSQS